MAANEMDSVLAFQNLIGIYDNNTVTCQTETQISVRTGTVHACVVFIRAALDPFRSTYISRLKMELV